MFVCLLVDALSSQYSLQLKGHVALESGELVHEKRFKPFVMKCIHVCWKDVLKVEYNDQHKYALKLRGFPFTF